MDIIIRNGKIQKPHAKENTKVKLQKKNYNDNFCKDIPGPYYDFSGSHICIPRWHYEIKNFTGPQIKNRLKLDHQANFKTNTKYCCICHEVIKSNTSFLSKRKVFYDEDIFKRKEDIEVNYIETQFKKMKLDSFKKNEEEINQKWNKLFYKIYKIYKIYINKQ